LDDPVIRGRDPVFRSRRVSVIRKGDWKLHLYHEEWQLDGGRAKLDTNNAVELYNIAADIGERNNLANTNKAKRDELLGDLLRWFAAVNAPLPTERNPTYTAKEAHRCLLSVLRFPFKVLTAEKGCDKTIKVNRLRNRLGISNGTSKMKGPSTSKGATGYWLGFNLAQQPCSCFRL
jgi:hypothetical protein